MKYLRQYRGEAFFEISNLQFDLLLQHSISFYGKVECHNCCWHIYTGSYRKLKTK